MSAVCVVLLAALTGTAFLVADRAARRLPHPGHPFAVEHRPNERSLHDVPRPRTHLAGDERHALVDSGRRARRRCPVPIGRPARCSTGVRFPVQVAIGIALGLAGGGGRSTREKLRTEALSSREPDATAAVSDFGGLDRSWVMRVTFAGTRNPGQVTPPEVIVFPTPAELVAGMIRGGSLTIVARKVRMGRRPHPWAARLMRASTPESQRRSSAGVFHAS